MELSDIKKSLSELNDDELRSLLTTIRSNRRTSKRPQTEKKSSKPSASVDALIASLTPEQILELLKSSGG